MCDAQRKRKRFGRDRFALRRAPVVACLVVLLFTVGIALLPDAKFGKLLCNTSSVSARHLGGAIFRTAGGVLLALLALDLGFSVFGRSARGLLLSLPFLIVALNNAPWIGLAKGNVTVHASAAQYALFAFYCLAVGFMEETAFRGIVLPLLLRAFPQNRKGVLGAVLLSSALFGTVHAVNFLSGDPLAVLAQIGYSFLIGAMCAVVLLLCRNVAACALLHALFDFCGLLAEDLGSGQIWDAPAIALTAAVGVLAAAYGVFLFWRRTRGDGARTLCKELGADKAADASEEGENGEDGNAEKKAQNDE